MTGWPKSVFGNNGTGFPAAPRQNRIYGSTLSSVSKPQPNELCSCNTVVLFRGSGCDFKARGECFRSEAYFVHSRNSDITNLHKCILMIINLHKCIIYVIMTPWHEQHV